MTFNQYVFVQNIWVYNCYAHDVFMFLSLLCFFNCIMGCITALYDFKIENVYVPKCFEMIEKHVAQSKHAQNFQKQQLNIVIQKTYMFLSFCLIISFSWVVSCKHLKALSEEIEGLLLKGVGCVNNVQTILDVVNVGVGGFACKVSSHHLHCEDYNELL